MRCVLVAASIVLALVGGCSSTGVPGDDGPDRVSPTDSVDASWDVLVFTHSQGGGIAEAYAPIVSEAIGVPVIPHGAAIDYLTAERALEHLAGTRYPPVGDLVREAEIIVVGIANPFELEDGWGTMCDAHGPRSTDISVSPPPTESQMDEALIDFGAELDEIARLRGGRPTVLFGLAHELGKLGLWQELGIDGTCMDGWEMFYEAAGDIVRAHGGTMVYTMDAFNGPNHDQPVPPDLLSDGTHLSEAGIRLASETLAAQALEPVPLVIP